ncbi:hypothetical protein OSTOST_00016 [Ostertagia ostertagi]
MFYPTLSIFGPDTIVLKNIGMFYPTLSIFGPDTIVLKSLVADNSCGPLRPQFPRPASTAYLIHPLEGRLVLVDMDDRILLTGELRQLFNSSAIRATVQVSRKFAGLHECQPCDESDDCYSVEDAAVIVGSKGEMVTLAGVFPWFEIDKMRSLIIDIHWTKVCTNITYLASGALSAHALIKRVSTTSSNVAASIVVLEYVANNYTEALVNKHQVFSSASAHTRPIDQSLTGSTPCSEENLGPVQHKWWIERLSTILSSEENDTTVIIGSKQLVTGEDTVLGTSVVLTEGDDVFCGTFEPLIEKTIAVAKFEQELTGYIKLTQYGSSNWATGIPTEIYYSITPANRSLRSSGSEAELQWQFVEQLNNSCSDAPLFNPSSTEESLCLLQATEFCQLGDASRNSANLIMNSRQYIVVNNLPLSGPHSILESSLRLRLESEDISECAPLLEYSEVTFYWIAPSNTSLAKLQLTIAEKLDLQLFQVQFDYTREAYKKYCSVYRVTILEEDWRLSQILSMFDVEGKKFTADAKFECSDSTRKTTPSPADTSSVTGSVIFFTVFIVILLNV